MIDRAVALPRVKAGRSFGRLDAAVMVKVDRALAAFLRFGRAIGALSGSNPVTFQELRRLCDLCCARDGPAA
jgi:hypothetical protein